MSGPTFSPGPMPNTVIFADGKGLTAPEYWILLPSGDAHCPTSDVRLVSQYRTVFDPTRPPRPASTYNRPPPKVTEECELSARHDQSRSPFAGSIP
jgi:hypothetical protein